MAGRIPGQIAACCLACKSGMTLQVGRKTVQRLYCLQCKRFEHVFKKIEPPAAFGVRMTENHIKAIPRSISGYKGVYAHSGRWRALIQHQGRSMRLGVFDTAEEAAKAYNDAALLYHGPEAYINPLP